MINSTEKLENFKSTVFSDAEEKAAEILEETRAECEEKLKRARIEADELIRRSTAEADETARQELVKSTSSQSLAARKELLLTREKLIDKVFSAVTERVRAFTGSPEYPELLKKRLKECSDMRPGEKGIVRLRAADMALGGELTLGGLFTAEASDTIELGGLTVVFPEENLAFDCTFDSVLEQERSTFAARL